MGTVWSAYDEFLQRSVAVKGIRMPPGVPAAHLSELRVRTLREARATAVLSHPNVIVLHDVVRENDDPYVVMELLPSRSLAALLKTTGRLTAAQAAAVADAVAAALEAAHAAGVTHRDVKPGNVLVCPDGRIKLTDFGIARNVSEVTMTHTGTVLGSPAFIAPEVASGGSVTHTADLWGLGAMLFAATEGQPPYDADGNPLDTVARVVHADVPLPSPGPLAPIIQGLMTKKPADRMSLAEVRHRLYPLLPQPGQVLFPQETFQQHDVADPVQQHEPVTHVIPQMPNAETSSAGSPTNEPLAADPGPLPFPLSDRAHPSGDAALIARLGGSKAVLIVAVLVFLTAATLGFTLVHVLAG